VNKLTKKPKDDELLTLYGFYKQATKGDIDTGRRTVACVARLKCLFLKIEWFRHLALDPFNILPSCTIY
jgi:hypothetical protein